MTKLNWKKAKAPTRTLSLEDEQEFRQQDRAAKWLQSVEANHFQNGSRSEKAYWLGKGKPTSEPPF
jgi:hypothetical protein